MTLVTDKEIFRNNKLAKLGWVLGFFTFVLMLLMPAPQELSSEAWCVAALGILMAILWITEAIPLPATALLPIPLVPLLGVASVKDTVSSYSHPVIFLFMGGFIVALAMERWKLHQRIALVVLKYSSDSPDRLIAGFMAISAFLSMWVSNTATTLMMLPIAVSVVTMLKTDHDHNSDLPKALMLALAYGATAGGMATLVGTPPNAFFAGFVKETYGLEVGFLDWMIIALPLSILMLLAIWVLLTKVIFKVSKHSIAGVTELIDSQFRARGKMTRGEISVGLIFITLAALWILRPWLNSIFPDLKLSDTVIGMSVGLSTFLIPVDWKNGVFVMNWEWGKKIPFGILILFGGGLTLASLIQKTGLSVWIGQQLSGLATFPTLVIVLAMVLLVILLTELTSNTATTATLLPVAGALAITLGEHPLMLIIPATLAVSCAFMLPVATPPNAIVFSAGYLSQTDMTKAGFSLNIIGVMLVTVTAYTLMAWVFGIKPGLSLIL